MDVSSIASTASAMQQGSLAQQVGVSVLKQALQANANVSLQLIQAISPAANNLPPNLGQNINVQV